METVTCEVWILVDETGDYTVSTDADELQAPAGYASRMVKVTVNVPVPKAVELEATLAEEPAVGELKVA